MTWFILELQVYEVYKSFVFSPSSTDSKQWVATQVTPILKPTQRRKCVFCAGPKFGALEGHLLIIDKALYGLRTSGARFHAKFADTLRILGFKPSYTDPDVWLRDAGSCYECVVVHVDDTFTALKNLKEFYDALKAEPWNYKLKNVEEPKHHLGGDFLP